MNWKCRFGFHDWKYTGQQTLGGYTYQAWPHIIVNVGRRTIYIRTCCRCDKDQNFYPRGKELADIIKTEQKLHVTYGMSENGVG